jgi:hypothetical protein
MGFPIYKLNTWFNFIFVFAIPKYDHMSTATMS